MKPPISLRWFLSLQLGLALVVQFVIVAALAWHLLLPKMRADVAFHHYAFARTVAGEVAAQVLIGERQLSALAEYIEARPSLPVEQWAELLDAQCGDGDIFEAIYLTDARNEAIRAIGLARDHRGRRHELKGSDLSGRDVARTTQFPGAALWSDTFLSKASGRMAVAVSIPLGEHVIVGDITVDRLSAPIRRLPLEAGWIMMILDQRGRIVADTRGVADGRPFDAKQFSALRGLRDGAQLTVASASGGRPWVGTVAAIGSIGWKVMVVQPYADAYQPIRTTFLAIGLGLLIAVALALAFAWFQSSKMVHLFNTYYDLARAIAHSDYDVPRPAARTREFLNLASPPIRWREY
ncbi:MAG: cache domain-containing protein [Desulfatitalea sp.]|nr:cache domain-containing protein [Desulfatitalea sp.]